MESYQLLEEKFGQWIGNPNCVACSSGTAALHLAIECLGLPINTKVLMSDYNMIACPRAVSLARHKPAFVDCLQSSLLLSPQSTYDYTLRHNVSAIMATHIYGRQCDMASIAELASLRKLKVIEDMSEIHGVNPHPNTDAACWSFYKNKIVAGEEGGMIGFKNPVHAQLARQLRSLGFTVAHDYNHVPFGHNYRLSNVHADIILESLDQVVCNLGKRNQVEEWYNEALPQQWRQPPRDVCWVYDLRIKGMRRDQQDILTRKLIDQGVAARHGFKPCSSQLEYQDPLGKAKAPNTYLASQEVIYLPVRPMMTQLEVIVTVEMVVRTAQSVGIDV